MLKEKNRTVQNCRQQIKILRNKKTRQNLILDIEIVDVHQIWRFNKVMQQNLYVPVDQLVSRYEIHYLSIHRYNRNSHNNQNSKLEFQVRVSNVR